MNQQFGRLAEMRLKTRMKSAWGHVGEALILPMTRSNSTIHALSVPTFPSSLGQSGHYLYTKPMRRLVTEVGH